ncbi:MAG: hypothetical protein ABL986_06680 [Vicinamibacterales bacterium]
MYDLKGGRVTVWAVPILFGVLAFAFRALSAPDLANDHYMTLGWAQQVLFGEWPERDFVEPGMPLSYLLSAAAQYFWPGPFSELVLTAAMLAAAAGITTLVAARLSGSWIIGVFAACFELALNPRFHSFHKVLTPVVAILLLQAYARVPSRVRLLWLGAWVVIAALFRHDLGVYIGLATVVGLLLLHADNWRDSARALGTTVAGGAIIFLPYAAYVQWAVGWREHLRRGYEFLQSDTHQIFEGLPALADIAQWNRDGAVALLFFLVHGTLVAMIATLVLRRRHHSRETRAIAAAVATALAAFIPVILREPVDGRLTDLAGVAAMGMAWLLGEGIVAEREASRGQRPVLTIVTVLASVLFAAAAGGSVWLLARVGEQIDNTGVYAGRRGLEDTWRDLRDRGTIWPWARSWPSRELPQAVLYLRACTSADDAVLLTWPAPEYNFFSRRRFAAGHVEFLPPSAFTTPLDQEQMLGWLQRQRVPVILTNRDRYEEFARAYPSVASYLAGRYEGFGEFTIYDGSRITVSAQRGLTPSRTWGPERWPCGFQ